MKAGQGRMPQKIARGRGNQGDWASKNSGAHRDPTAEQSAHNAEVDRKKAAKKARKAYGQG